MAKLTVTGRLGKVEARGDGKYISFGIAEPNYKNKEGNFVTPWFNFLVDANNATGKFLLEHGSKIDVLTITATERQGKDKDNKDLYFHNVVSSEVITWKSGEKAEVPAEAEEKMPWEENA